MTEPKQQLHKYFLSSGETLAFAESCTGGLLSYRITQTAGASQYFLGSLVTYAPAMKREILGVRAKEMVSEECVREMVRGLFGKSKADWALAVSGIMEPGGKVYYAIMRKGILLASGPLVLSSTERKDLMEETATTLLQYLWQLIQQHAHQNIF